MLLPPVFSLAVWHSRGQLCVTVGAGFCCYLLLLGTPDTATTGPLLHVRCARRGSGLPQLLQRLLCGSWTCAARGCSTDVAEALV